MSVRIATPEDAKKIAEIQVSAWQSAYVTLMPSAFLSNLNVESRAQMWRDALSNPSPGITAVYCGENSEPIAYSVYGPSRDHDAINNNIGELVALNVHPSAWRKGIGSKLCRYLVEHAKSESWKAITLWVIRGNERARHFYEKIGFVVEGGEKEDSKLTGTAIHEVRYKLLMSENDG